jgi:Tol biopolymer transport system component
VALERSVGGKPDVWLLEAARDSLQRFTFGKTWALDPIWSPDGNHIAFGSNRKAVVDLYEKPLSGGNETLLWESPESKNIYDWSSDGRFILFGTQTPNAARDLWILPLFGEKKPHCCGANPV